MSGSIRIADPGQDGWRPKELPGYMGLIGPLWARREDTGWAYGLLTTKAHLNPAGIVHGGLLTSLLDHALSLIAWEVLERRPCVTVQLDTHFLAPARGGEFIEARGRIVRMTSSLIFMQGQLSNGSSDIAIASALLKKASRERVEA